MSQSENHRRHSRAAATGIHPKRPGSEDASQETMQDARARAELTRLRVVQRQVDSPLDVERVLKEGSLRVAFQPVCDLHTRHVIGYEALARFPRRAHATPRQWFDQASRLGLVQELELLAAATAFELLGRLPENVFLAVNVSPATAASPEFAEIASAVPPERCRPGHRREQHR